MSHLERCPHCIVPPMAPFTNGWGGVFLLCFDCGYAEPITRKPDPKPGDYARQAHRRQQRLARRNRDGVLYTRKSALEALRATTERMGRLPTRYELGPANQCPSESWLRDHFGTVRKAILAAGLTPRPKGRRPLMPNVSKRRAA